MLKVSWDFNIGDLVEFVPDDHPDEMEMRHLLCTGSNDSLLDNDYSLDKVIGIVLKLDDRRQNELICLWTNGKRHEIAPISAWRLKLLSPATNLKR